MKIFQSLDNKTKLWNIQLNGYLLVPKLKVFLLLILLFKIILAIFRPSQKFRNQISNKCKYIRIEFFF